MILYLIIIIKVIKDSLEMIVAKLFHNLHNINSLLKKIVRIKEGIVLNGKSTVIPLNMGLMLNNIVRKLVDYVEN
jgi:hypothetical protein